MPTPEQTLSKLDRKREFARARSKKFYDANKEKVLNKQKDARVKFNEEIVKAKKDRNIPLIIQPPQPAPEPIIEPVDLSVQPEVSGNRKTKSKKFS